MHRTVASAPQLRRAGLYLATASLVAIGLLTLIPESGPLPTASLCIVCGVHGGVDVVLNVLLFLPLGVALALIGVPWKRAILGMAALSACIETAQYFAVAGRDASLGDLLMNALGGALGFALATSAPIWRRPPARLATRLCTLWVGLWLIVQVLGSFAFAPALPATRYFGQLARTFERLATFRGSILEARVGELAVPNRRITDSPAIRERLAAGAVMSARVVPAGSTPLLAPIVRIADEHREEIVLLAQEHESLVFGLRTGAAILRVRPPMFRLEGAFAPCPAPSRGESVDTVRISARYGSNVSLRAERSAFTKERHIALGPELAWTLVLPAQWFLGGGWAEQLITWLWVAASLLPLGFWLAHRARRRDADGLGGQGISWIIHVIGVGALLVAGFLVVPIQFGLAPLPGGAWLSAMAGIAAGIGLERAARGRDAIG
jgi:hypothetical protein